jgi:hypothetical protein
VPSPARASQAAAPPCCCRRYDQLLRPAAQLAAAPNVNLAWAQLLVEELCRLGVNTFCVAPGGRLLLGACWAAPAVHQMDGSAAHPPWAAHSK